MTSFYEVKANYSPSDSWLLARDGQVLQQVRMNTEVRRLQWSRLEDVSPQLLQAIIYSEDKRFYSHSGIDWQAVAVASWRNMWNTKTRGASTLTMQLAGLLTQHGVGRRNFVEKIGQSADALILDNHWKKAEILEAYLNLVSFRGELQGVAAMSFGLFNKSPSSLDARESAVAAVLLRAPNAKPAVIAKRACLLLTQMQHSKQCEDLEGFVTLKLVSPFKIKTINLAPHLAQQLISQPGQIVSSSVDKNLQQFTNNQLRANLIQLSNRNVQDGAVLVLDNKTGQVLAWVGSSGGLSESPEVDSVLSKRQAGSTLKPFLYATAIEQKSLTAASILDDSPVRIETDNGYYIPQNYDKSFVGPVTVRVALGSSLNVPAVRTLLRISPDNFYKNLQLLGFSTLKYDADFYGYSLALGAADVRLRDLTNAYRALANNGQYSEIRFNRDANNVSKKAIFSSATAYILSDILSDNSARFHTFGLDSALKTRYWVAVKTGTSKDMRDNWCIGYTNRYTVGVWVGNASGSPMHDVSGVSGAAPIWRVVMDYLNQNSNGLKYTNAAPVVPVGVEVRQISFQPNIEPARREVFLAGTGQNVIYSNQETVSLLNKLPQKTQNVIVGIAYPGQGAIIALDPEISFKQQRILLKTTVGVKAGWQWQMDGAIVGGASKAQPWFPMPGRHLLGLYDAQNHLVDQVAFEVRGAELKAKTSVNTQNLKH